MKFLAPEKKKTKTKLNLNCGSVFQSRKRNLSQVHREGGKDPGEAKNMSKERERTEQTSWLPHEKRKWSHHTERPPCWGQPFSSQWTHRKCLRNDTLQLTHYSNRRPSCFVSNAVGSVWRTTFQRVWKSEELNLGFMWNLSLDLT